MYYEESIRQKAEKIYQLFEKHFGPTKAFRQAQNHICSLLVGKHPSLEGKQFDVKELEDAIFNARYKNTSDARDFFGKHILFSQYLNNYTVHMDKIDPTEELQLSISKIIQYYMKNINAQCTEEEEQIVSLYLELFLSNPEVLGYNHKFTLREVFNAMQVYEDYKSTSDIKYRHKIINFFVKKRIIDNYLPQHKIPPERLYYGVQQKPSRKKKHKY